MVLFQGNIFNADNAYNNSNLKSFNNLVRLIKLNVVIKKSWCIAVMK